MLLPSILDGVGHNMHKADQRTVFIAEDGALCVNSNVRLWVFGALNALLVLLLILHVSMCKTSCWSIQTPDEHGPRFLSAHIMQCKYDPESSHRVLPWALLLVLVLLLVQWNQTWHVLCAVQEVQAQYARALGLQQYTNSSLGTMLMDVLVVLGSLGAYLIVQYDHRWLWGPVNCKQGEDRPAAAPYNVSQYHGIGVALLLLAVIASHMLTALIYQFRVYPAMRFDTAHAADSAHLEGSLHTPRTESEKATLLATRYARYRRFAYINAEAFYILLALAFVVAYLLDGVAAAVWFEYCVLLFGTLLSCYNLYICVRLEQLYLCKPNSADVPMAPLRTAAVFGQNSYS